MNSDRLAFIIWVMGILLVILVIACLEIYISRNSNLRHQKKTTDDNRP